MVPDDEGQIDIAISLHVRGNIVMIESNLVRHSLVLLTIHIVDMFRK